MNEKYTEQPHTMPQLDPQKESIKLVKTARSGYTWEVKIHPQGDKLEEKDIRRVEELNNSLTSTFGGWSDD